MPTTHPDAAVAALCTEPVGSTALLADVGEGDPAPDVTVRLLGTVELDVSGHTIAIGSAKQRAVLALLALRRETVPADVLLEALWEDSPPPSAAVTLRSLIARLRRTFADAEAGSAVRLVANGSGYLLQIPADRVDAHRFTELTARADAAARRGEFASAAADLVSALGLWRGPALGDLAGRQFAIVETRRLDEARWRAVEELAEAELALGRPQDALDRARPLVAEHPLRERAWGQLMLAAYRVGRQAEALAAYRRLRSVLDAELGVEPTPALRELHERILRQDQELTLPQQLPRPVAPTALVSLPLYPTSFVGRRAELAAIEAALVDGARLLALTGVGGVGKTRLALQWAGQVVDRYPDGARLVEFAPITDPGQVVAAAATAIGLLPAELLRNSTDMLDGLCRVMRGRCLLLVLDNCEHLIESIAALTVALLAACPGVTIVATSREVLDVTGETVFRVPPMTLPAAQVPAAELLHSSDAVRLFCERARAADASFALTADNADSVRRIAHRLDGIPLALELAAARTRALGVGQVAERLGERLGLLAAVGRGRLARHATLRAAIDWSYELLTPAEQTMLARLAVFPAGFDLAAAESIAGPTEEEHGPAGVDLLARLVDKSLVVIARDGGTVRYQLLETIREYAGEKLLANGERDRVLRRHADHFVATAAALDLDIGSIAQRVRWAAHDPDNIRAALAWAAEQRADAEFVTLLGAVWAYWMLSGEPGLKTWVDHAVLVPAQGGRAADLHSLRAILCWDQGEIEAAQRARALALACAAESADPNVIGRTSMWMAELDLCAGHLDRARPLLDRAAEAFRVGGSPAGQAMHHYQRAMLALCEQDPTEALRQADLGLTVAGPAADDFQLPHLLGAWAFCAALTGDEGVMEAADRAVQVARRLPSGMLHAMALTRATQAAVVVGATERARQLLHTDLLPVLRRHGFRRWVADALELAAIILTEDDPDAAVLLLGTCETLRGGTDGSGWFATRLRDCRTQLSRADPDGSRRRRGRMMTPDDALSFALLRLEARARDTR